MALERIDSFAHSGEGNSAIPFTRKWTNNSGDGGFYDLTHVRASGHAMALVGNINLTLPTYQSFRVQGVAYYYASSSAKGFPISFLSGGSTIVSLIIEADQTLSVYAGQLLLYNTGTSHYVLTGDTYHYLEMSVQLGGGTPITVTAVVNVDGAQRINTTGNSNINATQLLVQDALMNGVSIGGAEGGGDTSWACDYYCLNNVPTDIFGATTSNINFLGDIDVYALVPVGDSTVTWQVFGGSGPNHYTRVNEIPPDDDTTYVYTDTTGIQETFFFQPIIGFTGTIFGAQLLIYAKKDAEGSRAFRPVIGTSTFDTDNYLYDYYDYFIWPMDTNNGTPWTPANFNAQSFGAEVTI
jgi:hypothetical protein